MASPPSFTKRCLTSSLCIVLAINCPNFSTTASGVPRGASTPNQLAERLLQFQRNNTAHDVRAATGRLRHNKAHRFSGVGLRYNHGGSDPAGTNEVDEVLFHHSLEHWGRETRVFFGIIQEAVPSVQSRSKGAN